MGDADDLRDVESHFAFGENWASFSEAIDEDAIRHSMAGVEKLLAREELEGRSFLDIGCGSGLHSLAASRLGVSRVLATDIDPNCVRTTSALVAKHGAQVPVETRLVSVFDLNPAKDGPFDIVYSWGVLHHTGSMLTAIEKAAAMTAPGGLFAFALYRRTSNPMDRFWTWEKRWYSKASETAQRRAQDLYIAALRLRFAVSGRDFARHVDDYRQRGAEFKHDVHDWLGGYPYEVISPDEVSTEMHRLGFEPVRSFTSVSRFGLFGSSCDEYVYREGQTRTRVAA